MCCGQTRQLSALWEVVALSTTRPRGCPIHNIFRFTYLPDAINEECPYYEIYYVSRCRRQRTFPHHFRDCISPNCHIRIVARTEIIVVSPFLPSAKPFYRRSFPSNHVRVVTKNYVFPFTRASRRNTIIYSVHRHVSSVAFTQSLL